MPGGRDGQGALGEDAGEVLAVLDAGIEVTRGISLCCSFGGSVFDGRAACDGCTNACRKNSARSPC